MPTLRCGDEDSRHFVLGNLRALVVKPANESGGYGVLVGHPGQRRPSWTQAAKQIEDEPDAVGGPADDPPVHRPHAVRRGDRPAARGPPALHPARPGGRLRHPGRPHPGGPDGRLAGGQLVPGGRQQGHLGGRHADRAAPSPPHRAGPRPGRPGGGRRRPIRRAGPTDRHADSDRRPDPTRPDRGPTTPNPEPKEPTMLLARMAEAVYWAGRYLERAEGTARIVQVHTDTHVDMPVGEDVGWEPLLAIVGRRQRVRRALRGGRRGRTTAGRPRTTSSSSCSTARRTRRPSSAPSPSARENLRTARPVVPREAWEAVQQPVAGQLGPPGRGATRARAGSSGSAGSSPGASGSTASCSAP